MNDGGKPNLIHWTASGFTEPTIRMSEEPTMISVSAWSIAIDATQRPNRRFAVHAGTGETLDFANPEHEARLREVLGDRFDTLRTMRFP